jgi:hypothetical protein
MQMLESKNRFLVALLITKARAVFRWIVITKIPITNLVVMNYMPKPY